MKLFKRIIISFLLVIFLSCERCPSGEKIGNAHFSITSLDYSQGEVQALNAIRIEEKVTLPSGEEVIQTTNTQIEMLDFSVNIN